MSINTIIRGADPTRVGIMKEFLTAVARKYPEVNFKEVWISDAEPDDRCKGAQTPIHIVDRDNIPVISYTAKKKNYEWRLIPDPHAWGRITPEVELLKDFSKVLSDLGKEAPLSSKLFWGGRFQNHAGRRRLFNDFNSHPEMDIRRVDSRIPGYESQFVSFKDMVRNYKYLLDIEGLGWSGRLSYLMFSRRLLFIVSGNFTGYALSHLRAFEHYIPVKEDLSDLEARLEWAKRNPKESERIIENCLRKAQEVLTEDAMIDRVYEVWKLQNRIAQ